MNFSTLRTTGLLLLAGIVLSGCAGMRVGPGTTTGAVIGGAASVINHDGGRAAVIGTAAGALVDILSGEEPIEVEPYRDSRIYRDERIYRDPRIYRDDPYYRGPVYREPPRVYRPAPPPPRRHYPQPRRYYDNRCGCYR
ncbi:MAG: hypothetical protein WCT03_24280 [Candidatus Obscuribacterales bacterium]|jgi:hypothetical protein